MRRRRRARMIGALVVVAIVGVGGALALAYPGPDGGVASLAPDLERASRAAAALTDAHPEDRAVLVLSEVARREATRIGPAPTDAASAASRSFAARAEEHLVSGGHPAAARAMLSELVRGLRGEAVAAPLPHAPQPGPPLPVPQPAVPAFDGAAPKASAVGRHLTVEAGQTVETASVVGGDLTVRGHVLGDAVAVGGSVRLEPGARVDGDVVSVGGQVVESVGASVGGDRTQIGPATLTRVLPLATAAGHGPGRGWGGLGGWLSQAVRVLGFAFVMVIVGLVVLALAPRRTRTVMATMRRRPGMSLLSGLLTVLATGAASFLLLITFVGIAVIPLLWLALALAGGLGLTAAAHVIGEALPGKARSTRSSLWCLVLGLGVLALVSVLPYGAAVVALVGTVALGAVIVSRAGGTEPRA